MALQLCQCPDVTVSCSRHVVTSTRPSVQAWLLKAPISTETPAETPPPIYIAHMGAFLRLYTADFSAQVTDSSLMA
jgi:hypothetical protein